MLNMNKDKGNEEIKLETIKLDADLTQTKKRTANSRRRVSSSTLKSPRSRGKTEGSFTIPPENHLSCEIVIDFLEEIKKNRLDDKSAKFTAGLKEAFKKAYNNTQRKYELKIFDDKPEIILIGVVAYMAFEAIGIDAIKQIGIKILELLGAKKPCQKTA